MIFHFKFVRVCVGTSYERYSALGGLQSKQRQFSERVQRKFNISSPFLARKRSEYRPLDQRFSILQVAPKILSFYFALIPVIASLTKADEKAPVVSLAL